ncbi:MAG: O-succinylhomoserine sulfhydrylase [Gordonia sp. (in: high G+C Gram-positive bacteria)]|uniref:O-succinylhomoserine sulfhydrylase n=1 Tax=Gordonia sp. (in: high G+C Gram-positive bacteria) TaxID=84139 RepID=UPI0039E416BF
MSRDLPEWVSPETIAVRGGLMRSGFFETSEALYLNSGYVYDSAEAAERAFTGEDERFVYTRYGNPTVEMFTERLRQIEGTEAAFATASGMAAVFVALGALLKNGDRLVAARSLFGSCFVICNEILPAWGVETVFVDGEDLTQWEEALSVPTTAVFFETPSNPMQTLVDVRRVSELAHAAGARVVLDNVFATPLLQRGLDMGADVIVYSGTKHIDGQGRVMGGAVMGTEEYITGPVRELMRHTGPALSPFNAWVMLKGLETMKLRVDQSVATALKIAEFLDADPRVARAIYPFLPSHPQYELAKAQMAGGGTVITFELGAADGGGSSSSPDRSPSSPDRSMGSPDRSLSSVEGKQRAFEVLNRLQVIDISNNLGDAKSLITHPATTTHRAMGPEGRAAIGLTDAMVRLSVGLENADDLIRDLDQALG